MNNDALFLLQSKKIKVTPLRRHILGLFLSSRAPLSIPELLRRLHRKAQKANKTSVYRNLEILETSGLLMRVNVSDRSQYYELRERTHHHHLVCLTCSRIFDLPLHEKKLLEAAEIFSQKLQFAISRHAVEFYGMCSACQGLSAA